MTHVEDKWRENRFSWIGHVQRTLVDALVRQSDRIVVFGDVRGWERPKLTKKTVVKRDIKLFNLTKLIALDRAEWR